MKRLAILLVLLFCPASYAQNFVQKCQFGDPSGASHNSAACTFVNPLTAGNSVILTVGFGVNTTITAGDNVANSFTAVANCRLWDTGHNQGLAVLRARIATGGGKTVTVNFVSPTSYVTISALEVAAAGDDDKCAVAQGTGTTPRGPSLTLGTTAGEYIFSAALEDAVGSTDTLTPAAGFTTRTKMDMFAGYADADKISTSTIVQGAWTLSPPSDWIALTYAIKPSSVVVRMRFLYDDRTPFAGSAALFTEGATETNVANVAVDATGLVSVTFQPEPSKTYHAILYDVNHAVVFEDWSLPLSPAFAQQAFAILNTSEIDVIITKATGRIAPNGIQIVAK